MNKRSSGIVGNKGLLKGILLCCAVAVIPLPVILVAYSVGECCLPAVVPWTAGEMLSYCGTLGAALVAIFGVYWSLRENSRAQERQVRDDAAPFLRSSFLSKRTSGVLFRRNFATQAGLKAARLTLVSAAMLMPLRRIGKNTAKRTARKFTCFLMRKLPTRWGLLKTR